MTPSRQPARSAGRAEVSYALHVLGSLEGHLGRYDDGIARLHESLELAVEGDDTERIGSTWHNLVEAYVFAGRAAEAVDLAERGLADLERLGLHRTYAALIDRSAARWPCWRSAGGPRPTPSAPPCSAGDVDPYFALPVKFGRLHLLVRQRPVRRRRGAAGRARRELRLPTTTPSACAPRGRPSWRSGSATGRERGRALARADEITATTDEIMLELRLTALATRLEADEYGWSRAERRAAGPASVPRRAADARLRRAEAFLERIEKAVGCRSAPFHQTLELARAERSRLDDPPPPAAVVGRRRGVPVTDTYLAAYARWRQAEALLGGDARAGRPTAAQLLGDAAAGAAELGAAAARRRRSPTSPAGPASRSHAAGTDGDGDESGR